MVLPAIRRRHTVPAQWNPFTEFEDLYDRMGRLLESTFGETTGSGMWTPLADVSETDDSYIAEVEVPGMSKDDIDIQMSGNELVVSGETRKEEEEGKREHRRTRRYGRFEYRTVLPSDVDAENVAAKLEHGILTITIPKSTQAKPRRITISQG